MSRSRPFGSARWILPTLGIASIPVVVGASLRVVTDPAVTIFEALVHTAPAWYTWAPLAPLVAAFARRVPPFAGGSGWNRLAHLAAAGLASALHLGATGLLLEWLGSSGDAFAGSVGFDFVIYAGILGTVRIADDSLTHRAERARSDRLAGRRTGARLRALLVRMQSGWILRALGTTRTLLHREPARARRILSRLSDLLRQVLETAFEPVVPLERELFLLNAYLDLQRSTLGEEFEADMDVEWRALERRIPSFLLLTLTDLALRMPFAEDLEPGAVRLRASLDGRVLRVAVISVPVSSRTDGPRPRATEAELRTTIAELRRIWGPGVRLALDVPGERDPRDSRHIGRSEVALRLEVPGEPGTTDPASMDPPTDARLQP